MAFIIKPIVTEKMTKITEKRPNRYGFIVKPEANKLQIKQEVEARYGVSVEDVNTMNYTASALRAIRRPVSSAVRRTPTRRLS